MITNGGRRILISLYANPENNKRCYFSIQDCDMRVKFHKLTGGFSSWVRTEGFSHLTKIPVYKEPWLDLIIYCRRNPSGLRIGRNQV